MLYPRMVTVDIKDSFQIALLTAKVLKIQLFEVKYLYNIT